MKAVIHFFVWTGFLLTAIQAKSQDSVGYFLSKIQNAYKSASTISFSVKYTYSTELVPQLVLDSAEGSYKISGHYLWSLIDSTETAASEDLIVVAFHRERKIYLDKPDKPDLLASVLHLDSFLLANGVINQRLTGSGEIAMQFGDGSLYQKATIGFDPQTFLITKLTYLLPPTSEEETANALVSIRFSGYDLSPFETDIIAPKNYVERQKNAFAGVGRMKEYEVFVGSSKLLN